MLCGRVPEQSGNRDQTGDRSRVDYVTESLLPHDWLHRLHAVDDAGEIDVDPSIPILELVMLHLAADDDAGIVEHEIEPSAGAVCFLNDRVHGGKVRDVDWCRPGASALGPN